MNMTNEDIIKLGSAITSIAVAANTIYNVAIENYQQKQLTQASAEPTGIEALDCLTKQLNRI